MRGTQGPALLAVPLLRFIPAYAGNARLSWTLDSNPTVHPRVCGERAQPMNALAHEIGSSPRMRGTHRAVEEQDFIARFIPAYAGNALWRKERRATGSVHPRVCGERQAYPVRQYTVFGSSPRMRGTLLHALDSKPLIRFIPAYAGNARLFARLALRMPVHPRVCGERVGRESVVRSQVGSSPRMRGTPLIVPA